MTNGNDRMERIEAILDQGAHSVQDVAARLQDVHQQDTAARQQYHDEAFERHDAEMKLIREASAANGERIRALARIAELHNRRVDDIEGGEPA
jgi:hypothetical protein